MFERFDTPGDWGNAPRALGMTVEDGVLRGSWTEGTRSVGLMGVHDYEEYEYEDEDRLTMQTATRYFTRFVAELKPPLRMSLSIAPRGAAKRLAAAFGASKGVSVAIPDLDSRYDIHCPDVAHAGLVLAGRASQALVEAAGVKLVVDDASVHTRHNDTWTKDVTIIERDLAACARVAAALLDGRAAHSPEWERALMKGWADVAAARGLAFDPNRPRLHGELGGFRVEVDLNVNADHLSTHVNCFFPTSLGLELNVFHQEKGLMARVFRGQDVTIGVREFDDSFVVKGNSEQNVRRLLRPPVVERLLGLRRRSAEIAVHDTVLKVRIERGVVEAERVDAMLEAVVDAAHHVIGSEGTPRDPYRA